MAVTGFIAGILCASLLIRPCEACFSAAKTRQEVARIPQEPPTEPPRKQAPPTKPPQWYSDQAGSGVRFLVMGDFGGQDEPPYTTYDQLAVAKAAETVANSFRPDFVIELGDNFYENGVKHVRDPRFRQTFENVYRAASLQIPWYIVAGNHDWEGNILAQIEYTKYSNRWNFPSLYYTKEFSIPSSPDSHVVLVVIDTVLLCGMGNRSLPGSPPTGPWNVTAAEEHWNWLELQLRATSTQKAKYVLVAGHYPVQSVGSHGPTECLVQRLEPLLVQFHVSAYFAGHDHNLQHIHKPGSPVDYFVSGAASIVDPATKHLGSVNDWLHFHMGNIQRKGGFAYAEATRDRLTIAFTDAKDVWDLYITTLLPRNIEE